MLRGRVNHSESMMSSTDLTNGDRKLRLISATRCELAISKIHLCNIDRILLLGQSELLRRTWAVTSFGLLNIDCVDYTSPNTIARLICQVVASYGILQKAMFSRDRDFISRCQTEPA